MFGKNGKEFGGNGMGFRVVSPHIEHVDELPQNGNQFGVTNGKTRLVVSLIGTCLSYTKAKEIADQLNRQIGFPANLLPGRRARVIPDQIS